MYVMRWLKRLGWLVVAGLLVVVVAVGAVYVTHPRDEYAFLGYVPPPGQSELLARGDAACDWLDDQWRVAVEQPELDLSVDYLSELYEAETGENRWFAREAWGDLCGGTALLLSVSHPWDWEFPGGGD